jgi:hypothetical protein
LPDQAPLFTQLCGQRSRISAREQAGSAADGTSRQHELDDIASDDQKEDRNDGDDHAAVDEGSARAGPNFSM